MKTYIGLFRGINVVGRHIVPMKNLRLALEEAGCVDVHTYIQSGNVVFRSALDAAHLSTQLAAAAFRGHGFVPRVLVRTLAEFERAAAGNPFPEADDDPKSLHLFFLAKPAKKPDLKSLGALKTNTERFVLKGRVFYLHTPSGFGTSKLAKRAERLLGVDATARNWRTVKTLLSMAKEAG
ncbi:MAG: DUF1697 domain-containing protein [Planctomycetaceae bacterium]|nr:DUF1697 domain-containing protein [Planctomycetaceae bacterium]